MRTLHIDIETRSDVSLKEVGPYRYAQSPLFRVLLFAYAFDDEPVTKIDLTREPLPTDIWLALFRADVIKMAHNAAFEWYCLSQTFAGRKQLLPISQWRCTQLHAQYCGLPASLDTLGKALRLPQDKQKMSEGRALIRTFCCPHKPTKKNPNEWVNPEDELEKWETFKTYNGQDVVTEREVERMLAPFPVPDFVQTQWEQDIMMNARGVRIDRAFVEQAIHCSETVNDRLIAEAIELTGLSNPNSRNQLVDWLNENIDEEVTTLRKEDVKSLLGTVSDETALRVLQIRKETSKTSVKKYTAMTNCICEDGRVRGLLQFYGANRTGRWAGKLVQVQNLPKNKTPLLDAARELVARGEVDTVEMVFGNVGDTLSQLIRTAFIASEGHTLVVTDYSAIEARVIAWLADETWRLDVFNTHGKIYEASAAQMFHMPVEMITKGSDLRQKGKVAELALGYQGSVDALKRMGALEMDIPEEDLPDIVRRWREASPNIVNLWRDVDRVAIECIRTERTTYAQKMICFSIERANGLKFMAVRLPRGRKLYYANPTLGVNRFGKESIEYDSMDQTRKTWGTVETYGGKLVENIVQAIARDCLADLTVRLTDEGYKIVFHVHDEVVIDGKAEDLKPVLDVMAEPIPWAPGLPLKGDGYTTDFYKKD